MADVNSSAVRFLVLRFLRRLLFGGEETRALRSSILAMGLGLIPLITVMVVADGMIDGITERYRETLSYHLQAHALDGDLTTLRNLQPLLRLEEEVRGAWIEVNGFGLAYSRHARLGVNLRGIEDSLLEDPGWKTYVEMLAGQPSFLEGEGALLGAEVARKLRVQVGDEIRILTTRRTSARQPLPRITTVRVAGILSSGYQDLDRLWVLLPLPLALRALPSEDYPPFLGIKLQRDKDDDRAQASLAARYSHTLRIRSWMEIHRNLYQNYQSTRTVLMVIMGMILLVSTVNIASALLMTYLERRKEVAILKSLGLSPQAVERYFTILGLTSTALGVSIGLVVGVLSAVNINRLLHGLEAAINVLQRLLDPTASEFRLLDPAYYLQEIPVRLSPVSLVVLALFSLGLGTVASWFPARKASRLKPLEVLRKV